MPLLLTSFDRSANDDEPTVTARNGALDQQHAVLGVDLVNLQVLRRDAVATRPSGHALALEDTGGGGTATDRAGPALHGLSAVGGALALEAVTLHGARE